MTLHIHNTQALLTVSILCGFWAAAVAPISAVQALCLMGVTMALGLPICIVESR